MDLLQRLLELLSAGTTGDDFDSQLSELLQGASLADLTVVEKGLQDHFDERRQLDVTDELVAELVSTASMVDVVRTQGAELTEAATQRQSQLDELAARVHPEPVAQDDSPAVDPPAAETDPPADPPAEVEPPAAVDPPATVPAPEPEPVAASAEAPAPAPARPAPTLQQIARHAPAGDVRPDQAEPSVRIRSAGFGGEIPDLAGIDQLLVQQWSDIDGTDVRGKVRVAKVTSQLPASRRLSDGVINDVSEIVDELRAKVCEPGGTEALVADGGICGPVDTRYDLTTIAHSRRPLRGAVGSYQTRRGGLRFDSPLRLSDIHSSTTPTSGYAIGKITEAQDAASTYDKSVQVITCGTATEKRVAAWYKQIEFGNFMARSNPERTGQFSQLVLSAFARFTEQQLFAGMRTNSIEVNAPQKLGATRDFLTAMNRQAIGYRHENRMEPQAVLDTVIPLWVGMGLLPDDQTNALQSYPEQYDVNIAQVESWLRGRGINVLAWYEDDYSTAAAAAGAVTAYPSSFYALMFHPGAHVVIDGGELDLGVFRDSTLVNNNTFRTFAEEWWETAMWGVESLAIEFALCANGASAGSRTPTCGS